MTATASTVAAPVQTKTRSQAHAAGRVMRVLRGALCCGALLGSATLAMAQSSGITVRAWATLAANVGPQMELRVNGTLVASTEVRASSYQNYSFPAVSAPAGAKVEVVFNNDAFSSDGDRNLFVESITVNGNTIASDAPGVVFDRGPGAQAFDSVDVMPGLSTLYWNGALRFTVASGGATPPTTPPPPSNDTPPAGYTRCASEWETCSFTGSASVVYGALTTWTSPRSFTGGTPCTNTVFGDPLIGTFKACYMKPTATTPTPLSLNLTIAGTGGVGFSDGSSCSASCSKTFNSGSTVTLAASPSAGYTFAGWGGACSGTSTCTVTMDAAKNVSATFSAVVVTRTLNLTITGTGGVGFSDGSSCASSCSKTFNNGSVVTLAAAPSAGFTFAGWGGACSGTSSTCTVTMDAAKTVSATFSASPAMLSVSVSGAGTVNSTPSGINCSSNCSAPFVMGSTVTLTATPATGFTFSGWSGACTGTASCTMTLSASASVGAAFTSTAASPITLSLVPNRTSGVAPLSVFFDASGTTSTVTTMPFHEIKYSWNFGDAANGAMWAHGTRPGQLSKNLAYGGVAGHVFETPGTYTVTLTAFDGQRTSSKTTTITVTDPNVVFSGTKTVCVANGSLPVAGVNGCPVGAAVANLSSMAAIADTWAQTSRRILFKRGDTWNTEFSLYTKSDIIIGAYGSGNPPLIRMSTFNTYGFQIYSHTQAINNFTIMDIDFVGVPGGSGYIVGASSEPFGNNYTFLRLRGNGTGGIGGGANGVSVTDCDLQHLAGGMGYVGVYVANSTGVSIQGNRIYDATGIEHNIRTHSTKVVISNNYLYGPAATKQAITVRGTATYGSESTWNGWWSEHIIVSDNEVDAGPNAGQLIEFAPTNTNMAERIRDVIFERNYVHGAVGTLIVSEVSERATIRNNLFVPTYDVGGTIVVFHKNSVGTPMPTSHFIYNNSFYQPAGALPNYAAVWVGVWNGNTVYPTGTVIKNNLIYAPFATAPRLLQSAFTTTAALTTTSLWTLANNSIDAQIKGTAPGFVTPPLSLADWKPTSGYAIGGGANVPVWDDFFLKPRTSSPSDMGAVQH